MKLRLQQVLEEIFEQCKIEYGLFPMGVTEESLRTLNKKAPLVEAYNILRKLFPLFWAHIDRFHLVHSLSILHHSLLRLSNTARFSPHIQLISSPNRDTVEFQYWIRPTGGPRSQSGRTNHVRLSIVDEETDSALEEAIYVVPGGRTALDYERTKIGIRWIRDGVEVANEELEGVDLSNAEELIEHLTKVHARNILQRVASETEGLTLWEDDELYFRLIDSSRQIRISVDLLTGRILLAESSNTSAMLLAPILQQAQHNLSNYLLPPPLSQAQRRIPTFKDTIYSVRLSLLKSHILTLAEYKGWSRIHYGYGYIHKADLDTFLPQQWSWEELLFLSLGREVIVIHAMSRQSWLIDLHPLGDGVGLRVVWAEKIPAVNCMDYRADWLDWLDTVRFYVRGRYAIYGIEKGLERRGVEYIVVSPPIKLGARFTEQLLLPLLSLKSKDLIPGHSSCWASENLIVVVVRAGDTVKAVWEGRIRHLSEVEQLLSSVPAADPLSYDVAKKVFRLNFTLSEESTPDVIVGALVKRFLAIERILSLVQQTKNVQRRFSNNNVFRLAHFNLSGLECVYGVDGLDGELWPVQILVGNHCDIIFRHDGPHGRFKPFITGWYNASGGEIGVLADVFPVVT